MVVNHFPAEGESHLVDILSRTAALPVVWVTPGAPLEPDKIHVLSPGHYFGLENGHFIEKTPALGHTGPVLIDTFLESLAAAQGSGSLAIILSGTGSDGTQGARLVKQAGGTVVVQEPSSAVFGGMASSVLLTGLADYVLPPAELALEVVRLIRHEIATPPLVLDSGDVPESSMRSLVNLLRRNTGFDLGAYKSETVNRRIERRMAISHISDFEERAHRV